MIRICKEPGALQHRGGGACASARTAAALVLLLSAAVPLVAQERVAAALPASSLHLIPFPSHVVTTAARFDVGRGARVVLAAPATAADRFAVRDFIQDIRTVAGLRIAEGGRAGRPILVGRLSSASVRAALHRLGVEAPRDPGPEEYALAAGPSEVVIGGASAAGEFYGMQTLKQLVRGQGRTAWISGVRIVDAPALRWRGISDDISRGPVPTLDYMKRQIRTLAAFKMNMYSPYMEHTFVSASHPLIAPEGGAITPAEARELVAYARRYHVEVVPELQTFGHLHKVLQLERYDSLAEVPYGEMLTPEQPGTYEFIADRYKELASAFPGRFFHIGADETFELGQGQSKAEVALKGAGPVYIEHLQRVHALLEEYGRRLMFWGDIALGHPELIKDIPRDMIAVNWDYSARDSYAAQLRPFRRSGLTQMVAPGVQNWSQIFPNEDAAVINIRNFVHQGRVAGALGMLNTSWDDDGESLFQLTWYGVVLGAAAAWQMEAVDTVAFDSSFDWAFFRAPGHEITPAIRELGSINSLLHVGATDVFFWRNPFTPAFQKQAEQMADTVKLMRLTVEDAEARLIRSRSTVARNADVLEPMIFSAQRFDHLGRKMETTLAFSRDYWDAYLHPDSAALVGKLGSYSGTIYDRLREMAEELSLLRQDYKRLWLAENRPYWLHSILARYDVSIDEWLEKSRSVRDILTSYRQTRTLPDPLSLGLGPEPQPPPDSVPR